MVCSNDIKKRLKWRFGYVLAAARGDACEDGQGGRPGRCVGHDSQGKRNVIIFCPSVVD